MKTLDQIRRIHIVRSLSTLIIGLVIAYIIPDVLGMVSKMQSGNTDLTKWQAAMSSIPIRIVHMVGLAIATISAIYAFRLWSLRFIEPRDGEVLIQK